MNKHPFLSYRRIEFPSAWTYYSTLEICFMLGIDYRGLTIAQVIHALEDRRKAHREQIVAAMLSTPKNEVRRHKMKLLHHNGKVIEYCLEKARELDKWLNGKEEAEVLEHAVADQEEA